jgi:DNA-binding transcriptional LysR family regulator
VSQQIAALEREVGAPLLDRGPGGLTLTETGQLLLGHADALASRLDAADAQLAELRAGARGPARDRAYASALATIVPTRSPAGGRGGRREVAVEASRWPRSTRRRPSATGGCTSPCASRTPRRRRASTPTRRGHELADEPMDAAVGPDHPLAGRRPDRALGARRRHVDAPSRDHLVHRACVAAGFEPRIAYVTRDPLAIGGLIRAGLAVSLTPRLLAGRLEDVRTIALTGDAPSRRLYALTPAVGARPRALRFVAP